MDTQDSNLIFDPTLTGRVVDALRAADLPAVLDEFEPGAAQVRIDPTDGRPVGHVAVAGTDGWLMIDTVRGADGFYDTTGLVTDLHLDHDAPLDDVVAAIIRAAFGPTYPPR